MNATPLFKNTPLKDRKKILKLANVKKPLFFFKKNLTIRHNNRRFSKFVCSLASFLHLI